MQRMLLSSREMLGEGWLSAWLEGPVWRFALMPGICGPGAVLGLWLPSVDRGGRYYPLTLAALSAEADLPRLIENSSGFFEIADAAGREAVAQDLPPEALAARLEAAATAPAADPEIDPLRYPTAAGLWWTEGARGCRRGPLPAMRCRMRPGSPRCWICRCLRLHDPRTVRNACDGRGPVSLLGGEPYERGAPPQ